MKLNKNIRYEVAIHSPEHSEAVQKRLFELGYKWFGVEVRIQLTDRAYLVLSRSNNIDWNFKSNSYQAITLDDLFNIETETSFQYGDYTVTHKEDHWYVSGPEANFELPFETVSEMCKEDKSNLFEKNWRIEHPNMEHAIAVRKYLDKMGFERGWGITECAVRTFHDDFYGVEIYATSGGHGRDFPLITFDDLFVEAQCTFKVGKYQAIKKGDKWTIGCQIIPHSFIKKLKKYQDAA